jgi:uroporphyrinogen decarboxylase
MTKKEDMIAAFSNCQPVGRVPLWELEFHLWDQVSGQRLVIGQEYQGLTEREKERALHNNAEIFLTVSERLHFFALTMPSQYWEIGPGAPAYYWMEEEGRDRQARILRKMADADLMLVANCSALLGMPMQEDYVDFAYRLFDAPDEIDALAEQRLQDGIQDAIRFFDLGVEIGLSTSDLADNHSTFMNPRQLERFVWPYLDRWVEALKKLGMFSILHSDGNLGACLNRIADSGVDCLQAIDPTAGMNMLGVKQKVDSRLCLGGNVDCRLLLSESPASVFEATRELLNSCKGGGGLILGASNAVQSVVPVENYLAITRAWEEFGSYEEPAEA